MRLNLPTAALLLSAMAASSALAQGYPNFQPPPPTAPTISFEWTGNAVRFTPATVPGCTLQLNRVFNRAGTIFANLRHAGTGARSVTLDARLQGTNQSKGGTGSGRFSAGQTADVQLMTPFGGSLTGTTIAVRVTGCATP